MYLAILFMVEIDNVAYSIGLSERIRSNFEQHGRIKLEDADAVALVKSKATHVSLIVISVLVAVRAAKTSYSNDLPPSVALIVSPVLAFWLAVVIVVLPRDLHCGFDGFRTSGTEKCRGLVARGDRGEACCQLNRWDRCSLG